MTIHLTSSFLGVLFYSYVVTFLLGYLVRIAQQDYRGEIHYEETDRERLYIPNVDDHHNSDYSECSEVSEDEDMSAYKHGCRSQFSSNRYDVDRVQRRQMYDVERNIQKVWTSTDERGGKET